MINFSALPQSNPFGAAKPGCYKATIESAEMRTPKDVTKKDYLSIKLKLTDHDGNAAGTVYDILAESEASIMQYKIARFIQACGLPLTGAMELKDIGKIVAGRTIVVDITHDKSEPPRAVVDIFSRGAYYPEAEYESAWAQTPQAKTAEAGDDFMQVPDGETVFNAPDGGAVASVKY